jgi:hypothetical protein
LVAGCRLHLSLSLAQRQTIIVSFDVTHPERDILAAHSKIAADVNNDRVDLASGSQNDVLDAADFLVVVIIDEPMTLLARSSLDWIVIGRESVTAGEHRTGDREGKKLTSHVEILFDSW